MTTEGMRGEITRLTNLLGKAETRLLTLETQRAFWERSAVDWQHRHTELQAQFSDHITSTDRLINGLRSQCQSATEYQRQLCLQLGVALKLVYQLLAFGVMWAEQADIEGAAEYLEDSLDEATAFVEQLPRDLVDLVLGLNSQLAETAALVRGYRNPSEPVDDERKTS